MLNYKKNKTAQVGDTISWIIATVVILVVLFLFVFATSLLSEGKTLITAKQGVFSDEISSHGNLILMKSIYVYSSIGNPTIKNEIYNNLKKWENEKENPADIDAVINNLK
ncbi:MAG: hypothetical protein WC812_03620 [Candidatus Pacearchaeota archaeon]|jgi:hypothetical protein